jgi:uncharacterized damage-inducible protein DinB
MAPADITNPQLKQLAEQVEAARAQARRVAGTLSQAQLEWQPGPGRWGVGQCLEHLLVTDELMASRIPQQLAALKARGGPPVFQGWKAGVRGGFLIRSIDPVTGKRRVKTGRVFEPGPVARPDVLAAYEKNLDRIQEWICSADGLDLTKARVASPMTRLITYHLGDALTITVVHHPRHLGQAERVKAEPGFPAA